MSKKDTNSHSMTINKIVEKKVLIIEVWQDIAEHLRVTKNYDYNKILEETFNGLFFHFINRNNENIIIETESDEQVQYILEVLKREIANERQRIKNNG